MDYKGKRSQKRVTKPVTFLSHENFLVYRSQSVTPGKHGISHFYTLSARDYFLRIRTLVFSQVKWGI